MTPGHSISGEYPADWPEIAKRIKEQASWRCERCGHPAEGPWKTVPAYSRRGRQSCDAQCTHPQNDKQRMLTVDHLDGNKSNCADYNLAVLCQVCHLQIQGKVRMEQSYAFEHTPWMQPHVDGMLKARESA